MVKDHSGREEKNHYYHYMGYSFQLAAMILYMHNPTDGIAHTTALL